MKEAGKAGIMVKCRFICLLLSISPRGETVTSHHKVTSYSDLPENVVV